MASRGESFVVYYYAWNTSTSTPRTDDVANHTLRLVKDGGSPTAPTNAASQIDATNMPGWYKVTLTTAEANAVSLLLTGKSSTSNVVLWASPVTTELLPTASPGTALGLATLLNNGTLPVDVTSIAGDSGAPSSLNTALGDYVDGSGFKSVVQLMSPDTLSASALAADAVAEIQSGLATADVLAAVKAKTDNLPASPAAVSDIPTASTVATAVWGFTIMSGFTALQVEKALAAALFGNVTGNGSSYKLPGTSTEVISATSDGNGNRTVTTSNL